MLGFDVGSNPSATQLDGRTPPPCSACIEQNLACQGVFWGQTVPGMATICHFDAIDAVGFMRPGAGGGGVLGSSFPAAVVVLLSSLLAAVAAVAADAAAAACCSAACAGGDKSASATVDMASAARS
jgi:hypothetical protein